MYAPDNHRTTSALAALAIVAAGFAAMLAGLAAHLTLTQRRDALAVLSLAPPRKTHPPVPLPPAKARSIARGGHPSPANLHNRATPVVAPPPPLPPLIVPPPVVAAPTAGNGAAAATGAADRAGPGRGAGGAGSGSGAAGAGSGTGTGSGSGAGDGDGDSDGTTRPRQIHGRLHFSDLPEDLQKAHTGGELKLQYLVGIDGRVSDCRILKSSGRPDLDATTCRLITERFRFRPSRETGGNPVPAIIVETHGWYFPPEANPRAP